MIVRGICTLIPEDERLSKTIQVTSIVGRHLEHARAFRFENGGDVEIYLSSADWMPRNLDRRYELLFLIQDPKCKLAIENVLKLQLMDNQKAWEMDSCGNYIRKKADGAEPVNAQEILMTSLDEVFAGQWKDLRIEDKHMTWKERRLRAQEDVEAVLMRDPGGKQPRDCPALLSRTVRAAQPPARARDAAKGISDACAHHQPAVA